MMRYAGFESSRSFTLRRRKRVCVPALTRASKFGDHDGAQGEIASRLASCLPSKIRQENGQFPESVGRYRTALPQNAG